MLNIAGAVNDSKNETKKLNNTLSDFISKIMKSLDNQKEINESIKKSLDNQKGINESIKKSLDNQKDINESKKKSLENQESSIEELKFFNNLVFEWMKVQNILNFEKNGENSSFNIPK